MKPSSRESICRCSVGDDLLFTVDYTTHHSADPNFDEDDTVAVFKVFIKRAKKAYPHFDIDAKAIKSFARKHYQESSEDARWNGRQIRNAFHTALVRIPSFIFRSRC